MEHKGIKRKTRILLRSACLLAGLWLLIEVPAAGQPRPPLPTANAYAQQYALQGHWTDSLAWNRVSDVSQLNGLLQPGPAGTLAVDSLLLHQTLQALSRQGGGVLYFPAGRYSLSYDLLLPAGVVLRGEQPGQVQSALQQGFAPPSRLEFPAYQPRLSGQGSDPRRAFKKIYADQQVQKVGLVNLDLNRVRIDLYAPTPGSYHNQVLLLGLRLNNSAMADPAIPSQVQRDQGHGWQRWPLHYKESLVVSVEEAAVIANCRLNDQTTDSYPQPNYMSNEGYVFSQDTLWFDQEYHRGIALYKQRPQPGKAAIHDNYVRNWPQLEKIHVAGEGVSLHHNRLLDTPTALDSLPIDPNGHVATRMLNHTRKLFQKLSYVTQPGDTMFYDLLKPARIEPGRHYPLVLFFHGGGESGGGNRLQHFVRVFVEEKARRDFPCFVLVPHLPLSRNWFSPNFNYPPAPPVAATLHVMEQLTLGQPIDRDRIYVTGLSDGGVITSELISRYPGTFAGAVIMSGFWNYTEQQCRQLREFPLWITAGEADKIVPELFMRLMTMRLQNQGALVNYKVYNAVGHFSWIPLYTDRSFLPWLFDQRRKPATKPRRWH